MYTNAYVYITELDYLWMVEFSGVYNISFNIYALWLFDPLKQNRKYIYTV